MFYLWLGYMVVLLEAVVMCYVNFQGYQVTARLQGSPTGGSVIMVVFTARLLGSPARGYVVKYPPGSPVRSYNIIRCVLA